jgi:hypothetical protein
MALRSLPCGQKVYLMPMQSRAVRSMTTLALFAGLGGFAGCHKGPQQGVAATVNGKPILQSEVDKLYAAQLANKPSSYRSSRS